MGRDGVKSLVGGLLVPTLPNMEMGAGWLGTVWVMTNKMAHDNGWHGTWPILEILPYDPSMWFYSHLISVSLHKVSLL